MLGDAGAEWQRLTRIYAEKSDEELLALAEDFGNLTEVAQQVLRDELKKRKLGEPGAARNARGKEQPTVFGRWSEERAEDEAVEVENDSEEDGEEPVEYTWKTSLCECDTAEEAWQIHETLRRAGIESWAERPGTSFGTRSVGSREIRIQVAADQVEEARAIIAKPIPQDVIDQSKMKVEDFVPPTCPKCGTADPVLESIEPTNSWRCENCGTTWSDPMPVENEGQN